MRLAVCILFLFIICLTLEKAKVEDEPDIWGMADHETVDNLIQIREDNTITIFLDDPHRNISKIYLSRDETCERVTLPMVGLTQVSHGYSATAQHNEDTRKITDNIHLHACADALVDFFEYERSLIFDITKEDEVLRDNILIYLLCIALSCLFSGLNLALLSLDVETLEMIKKYDENLRMRRYAEDIIPIRKNANLMICTIILGNTMVNVISTTKFREITEDNSMGALVRVLVITICPTVVLLVFGEILPQIVCTKYALPIGAHLKMVMQFFTFITFPLSKPLSWIMDFFIGKEKEKTSALREIVRAAGKKDTMAMIANNTLELRKKLARDVMTPLSQVKMLSDADKINAKLKQSIRMGHTRMPVCKGGDPHNIIGVLNVKDLLLLDESDHITVGTVLQLWPRESTCRFAPGDTPVAQLMLSLRNNAAMVIITEYQKSQLVNVPTGIVTLEDLLEEVVGEIYDEKDRVKMTGNENDLPKEERSGVHVKHGKHKKKAQNEKDHRNVENKWKRKH